MPVGKVLGLIVEMYSSVKYNHSNQPLFYFVLLTDFERLMLARPG